MVEYFIISARRLLFIAIFIQCLLSTTAIIIRKLVTIAGATNLKPDFEVKPAAIELVAASINCRD
jgi:hypothetical protein